jgi:hypothetical protein
MKLRNTSQFPIEEIRQLLRIATKGVSLSDTAIHTKNSAKKYAGRAYEVAPSTTTYRRLMVVRLGDNQYPIRVSYDWRYKTAPEFFAQNWQELFVLIAAHEARHIQQFKKGWRCSEIDAEKFAGKRLEDYRKQKLTAK